MLVRLKQNLQGLWQTLKPLYAALQKWPEREIKNWDSAWSMVFLERVENKYYLDRPKWAQYPSISLHESKWTYTQLPWWRGVITPSSSEKKSGGSIYIRREKRWPRKGHTCIVWHWILCPRAPTSVSVRWLPGGYTHRTWGYGPGALGLCQPNPISGGRLDPNSSNSCLAVSSSAEERIWLQTKGSRDLDTRQLLLQIKTEDACALRGPRVSKYAELVLFIVLPRFRRVQ